jgi:hypothetical protein
VADDLHPQLLVHPASRIRLLAECLARRQVLDVPPARTWRPYRQANLVSLTGRQLSDPPLAAVPVR